MKRIVSLVLALVLVFAMVPTALAASAEAPYSLPYLTGLDGVDYLYYFDVDDIESEEGAVTNVTLEVYDVFTLWLGNGASWDETLVPIRNGFVDAGYIEETHLDENGDEQYWYYGEQGTEVFYILGETAAQAILNEGAMVYIVHGHVMAIEEYAANALYELGLFNGTGTDANGDPIFDLDRAPTRQEAVTMLVRLLGKEEEAQNGTWTTPFTDVDDWAAPYVGYAYANGLTSGTSATTFGGSETVTAAQYLTFVLRALGYESGTDFQWDSAWELSDSLGITNGQYDANTTSFTRGDVAVISYQALSVDGKESTDTYTSYAITDFQRVQRQYSNATAQLAYVTAYTGSNGNSWVLTDVWYTIIETHHQVTLHNLTTGDLITDPYDYYEDKIDRAFGNAKLNYYDLETEFLEHYRALLSGEEGVCIDMTALTY